MSRYLSDASRSGKRKVLSIMPFDFTSKRQAYANAVASTWRLPPAMTADFPFRELAHAASLAANSHNTQPWRFVVTGTGIAIRPDFSRRTPVVDPDDHHLFVSLGCAAELLCEAAHAYGWAGTVEVGTPEGVRVDLLRSPGVGPGLSRFIPLRASTRAIYDGRALPSGDLAELAAAVGSETGLSLLVDRERLEGALDFIVAGSDLQVADRSFREELKAWIRFDAGEALGQGDGLYAGCMGNPTLPRFLGARLFEPSFNRAGEADRIARQVRSSAGLAVFWSDQEGPAGWIETGRAYTRFELTAARLGLKTAFLNQPVEVPHLRREFAAWLGAPARRPDLVVRFGYGPSMPRSLRRPVAQIADPYVA